MIVKILIFKGYFEELIKWFGNKCYVIVRVIFVNFIIFGWFFLIFYLDRKDEYLFFFIFKENKVFLFNVIR